MNLHTYTPDFSVTGRRALLTGAGRGIGLAMARALAAGGCAVAIQDIELDVATREADAINLAGGNAIALDGDIQDLSLPDRLVEQTVARFGGVDILVNNAAIQRSNDFLTYPMEEMRSQLNANILAATRLCQLVIPHMQKTNWGRIINIGSIQGLRGNASGPTYAMSKAAMQNLSAGLANCYGAFGITVNCVAPGWFDTHRNRGDFNSPEHKVQKGKAIPLRRVGEPEDCAGVVVLLCSRAGEYITGQTIRVDGGMSLR